MKDSYLLVMFYTNGKMVEYKTDEILLIGTDETIIDIAKKEIKNFNDYNKQYGYRVEQYNLFKHLKSESLKVIENENN
jgi:hypothetical protein